MTQSPLDLTTIQSVHLIGIGGIGISALARLLLSDGRRISGTNDIESPRTLDALREAGVSISLDTTPMALPEADCYVYSDAWPDNFPEVVEAARRSGKPTLSYFEMLGVVANRYYLIAVAGAHGKTTTTAMLTDVLEDAGLDPTAVIGSLRAKTRSNFRAGKSRYFVVEADEYRRHFLAFSPDVLIITNVEADHLDYYRDLADVQDAFRELALRVPADGFIVCDPNDPNVTSVIAGVPATVVSYPRLADPLMTLAVPGMHNLKNAAAVLGVVEALGLDVAVAKRSLEGFAGTWRRSERIGVAESGALVFDDYAHHPTEIETTVRAFRDTHPNRRLVLTFQPHLYSRTRDFFEGFVAALSLADEVLLAPVAEARREADRSVGSAELAAALGEKARAFGSYEEIVAYLRVHAGADDLILTMGAGAIYQVAEALVVTPLANEAQV